MTSILERASAPVIPTTSAEASLWLAGETGDARESGARHPALQGRHQADIVVIGGGIAGVSTALRLQVAGARVALLEAVRIGSGVTGNTSAKVSALQGTVLSTIASRHGREAAEIYAAASTSAVADVAEFAADAHVDCDLQRRPAVTYAAGEDDLDALAREFDAATAAGLPVRWDETDAGLPFAVRGAVWLDDQIGLHPVAYVRGLADRFEDAGGQIFESSRVTRVERGSPSTVHTDLGSVSAGQVIVSTHFPILDRGLFFARMHAERSYCVAARIRGAAPRAMAISCGDPTRSINWTGSTVIVGGEGHPAGDSAATPARFEKLEAFARAHWDLEASAGRWSAQDPVPYDHLPMIGPLVPRSRTLWVQTGWAKWGLTGGTFAARILAESMLGEDHEWMSRFTPTRLSPRSTPGVAKLGVSFATRMVVDRITPAEASDAREVPPGEARVVRRAAGKVGVYRDEQGTAHTVSLRCSHLGCLLHFNGAERSWDCPCHGSRFDVDGEVLEGPAVRPLAQP